jgi:hypothetical protein
VEVGDRQARRDGDAERSLEPRLQLDRRLDVVGQDEDLLRDERSGKRVCRLGGLGREQIAGRVGRRLALRLEEAADALDDDARLAGAGPRDDDEGSVLPVDDRALLGRQAARITGGPLPDRIAPLRRRRVGQRRGGLPLGGSRGGWMLRQVACQRAPSWRPGRADTSMVPEATTRVRERSSRYGGGVPPRLAAATS